MLLREGVEPVRQGPGQGHEPDTVVLGRPYLRPPACLDEAALHLCGAGVEVEVAPAQSDELAPHRRLVNAGVRTKARYWRPTASARAKTWATVATGRSAARCCVGALGTAWVSLEPAVVDGGVHMARSSRYAFAAVP